MFFKGRTLGGKIQRFFTRCDYDHVALLLKYKNSKIVLFESTGAQGIDLLSWDNFVSNKYYEVYQTIAFRHLTCPRTKKRMQALE